MANAVKWTAATERKIIENGSCNNNDVVAGTLANHTNKDRWMDLQMQVQFGNAPTAGAVFHVYLNPRVIGQQTIPTYGRVIGQFVVTNSTSVQICNTIQGIPIPPLECDITIENKTGQNATAESIQLTGRTYNEEIQ